MVQINNQTSKKKAVLCKGGHVVIQPGETKTVEAEFTDEQKEALKDAGLAFKGGRSRSEGKAE